MSRLAALTLGALASTAWASAPVGYAQATGYYKRDSRPTLYQPLNLLDSREVTQWCSTTSDPLSEKLSFGFKGTVKIDEVRVYTGNGFDDNTWKEYSRAKKFSIQGPGAALTFTVADERGLQSVALNPPLEGSHFTMEVLDQYPSEDPDLPVCVTDIVFYSDGKPLNGNWLTPKLKFDRGRAALLGTWFMGSEGAPDKYLSFFFDGTYRFAYEPFDPNEKPKSFTGEFTEAGGTVTFNVPGKGKSSVRVNRELPTPGGKRTLVLEGDLPPEMRGTWRDTF